MGGFYRLNITVDRIPVCVLVFYFRIYFFFFRSNDRLLATSWSNNDVVAEQEVPARYYYYCYYYCSRTRFRLLYEIKIKLTAFVLSLDYGSIITRPRRFSFLIKQSRFIKVHCRFFNKHVLQVRKRQRCFWTIQIRFVAAIQIVL